MIEVFLLAIIAGMLIGKFILEPLIEIYQDYKGRNILRRMWEDDDWES